MSKYQFSDEELKYLEQLPSSLAVYQYVDGHVYTLAVSDGYCEMFRLPGRETAYRRLNEDVLYNTHPDDVERLKETIRRFVDSSGRLEMIFRGKKYSGGEHHIIHGVGKHVYRENGARLAYVTFLDEGEYTGEDANQASSLNRAFNEALHEESILRASRYDHLTGLPSMTCFLEMAEKGKDAILDRGGVGTLLYLDLNGMKNYNESYGFAEGDKLLCSFAKLLERVFGKGHGCHISGDRFAAYTQQEGLEDALKVLFREAEEMNDGNSLPVRIGIYMTSVEDVSISSAYDRAKIACDMLPRTDTSSFSYYSTSMREEVKRRQYILSHFDEAISRRWIQVFYQPIIRAVTGRVCDEEALARWIDPVKGFMSPADFIPVLEDAGLIYKLDLYILDQVLEKIRRQREFGLHIVPQSINLSRADFHACDIVEEIRRRVDEAGIGRDKITIEITESMIGRDFDFMKEQVRRFQDLGFPVWMDDFGSGYSSLDVLQSIKFNLIKFDMGFVRRLDEGEDAKIILAELMKMATSLGLDTVCEGVETIEQVRFLQDIGCSKLQGFYYCRPIPWKEILERNRKGTQIGFENPEESSYFETIGRVNLFDLGAIVSEDEKALRNSFNMLPMGILEIKGDSFRYVRSNEAYRSFMNQTFHWNFTQQGSEFRKISSTYMNSIVRTCCEQGSRAFYDEKLPDGRTVHSFARGIGVNKVSHAAAVVIAILSVSEPDDGESYADIARALAADYYNIYIVDLNTDQFIEYTSPAGKEEMAMERHGGGFFEAVNRDTMTRIYEEDREPFLKAFSKEKIVEALNRQGVFTTSYRLIDTGVPVYAGMKVMRMHPGSSRIIIGISIIEAQVKQKEEAEKEHQQSILFRRIAALAGKYYAQYAVDPETGAYLEYHAISDFGNLRFDKRGENFFLKARSDVYGRIYPEDIPYLLEHFSKEEVMREIAKKGRYRIRYRLMILGKPTPVTLTAALVKESDGEKIIIGVTVDDE